MIKGHGVKFRYLGPQNTIKQKLIIFHRFMLLPFIRNKFYYILIIKSLISLVSKVTATKY